MILLILSFFAGILTVFAPCILPLLPLIIGGSITGDEKQKYRPYIIIGSLVVSLIGFTLLLKASTLLIGVDPKFWAYISGSLVIVLGFFTLFPGLWEEIIGKLGLQAKSQEALSSGYKNKNNIIGPILIGAALGPVFTSCSPTYAFVLASVLPTNFITGIIYLLVYSLGLGLVLLAIAIWGNKFLARFKWATDPHSAFRRGIGVIFIIVGLAVFTGLDKQFETWILTNGPTWYVNLDQSLLDSANR